MLKIIDLDSIIADNDFTIRVSTFGNGVFKYGVGGADMLLLEYPTCSDVEQTQSTEKSKDKSEIHAGTLFRPRTTNGWELSKLRYITKIHFI